MRFFKDRKDKDAATFQVSSKDFQELLKKFEASNDFLTFQYPNEDDFTISYFNSLVSEQQLHEHVLTAISNQPKKDLKQLKGEIPMEDMKLTANINDIQGWFWPDRS